MRYKELLIGFLCGVFSTLFVVKYTAFRADGLDLAVLRNYFSKVEVPDEMEENMSYTDGPIIGIDLGHSYSRVGVFRNETFEIITDSQGQTRTPSVVTYFNDEAVVGMSLKESLMKHSQNTIHDFWPLLGRDFTHNDVRELRKDVNFEIVDHNSKAAVKIGDSSRREIILPTSILSEIFRKLKVDAERHLNETVKHAVVSVPITFDDTQLQAVKDAAKEAGLYTLRILKQPIAIGLGLGLDKDAENDERTLLFYNVEESHTTVTVLVVEQGIYEVLGFRHEKASNVPKEDHTTSDINEHERSIYENEKPWEFVNRVLKEAKVKPSEVHVLLVTGLDIQTQPISKILDENYSWPRVMTGEDLNQAAVKGAAILASLFVTENDRTYGCPLVDVTMMSLGIGLDYGIFAKLIPRNWVIPIRKSIQVSTTIDHQTDIRLHIFEGERILTKHNKIIGTIVMSDILQMAAGENTFEVVFEMDPNYILKVMVVELLSGRMETIQIDSTADPQNYLHRDDLIALAETKKEDDLVEAKSGLAAASGERPLDGLKINCDFDLSTGRCKEPQTWID